MSDDEEYRRRPQPGLPPLVWGLLGILVVAAFVIAVGMVGRG